MPRVWPCAIDSVVLQLPGGTESLTVLEVRYERISVEPFREPPGSEASARNSLGNANPPDEETARLFLSATVFIPHIKEFPSSINVHLERLRSNQT